MQSIFPCDNVSGAIPVTRSGLVLNTSGVPTACHPQMTSTLPVTALPRAYDPGHRRPTAAPVVQFRGRRKGVEAQATYVQRSRWRGGQNAVVVPASTRFPNLDEDKEVGRLRHQVLQAILMKDCSRALELVNKLMDRLSDRSASRKEDAPAAFCQIPGELPLQGTRALSEVQVEGSSSLVEGSSGLVLGQPEGHGLAHRGERQFTVLASDWLGVVMKGQHENIMRACIAAGRLDLGLQYWRLLPAKPAFFSTMLRLTLLYGSAEDVQAVVQVHSGFLCAGCFEA